MASDLDDITALIAEVEHGFNTNDAAAMTRRFSDDALSVEPDGRTLVGRAAIAQAYEQSLDQYARLTVRVLAFPAPDTAVAVIDVIGTDRTGAEIDLDHTMVATYTLVRDGQRWQVAARQHAIIRT